MRPLGEISPEIILPTYAPHCHATARKHGVIPPSFWNGRRMAKPRKANWREITWYNGNQPADNAAVARRPALWDNGARPADFARRDSAHAAAWVAADGIEAARTPDTSRRSFIDPARHPADFARGESLARRQGQGQPARPCSRPPDPAAPWCVSWCVSGGCFGVVCLWCFSERIIRV